MRIDLNQTQALVIDIQERLFPHINNNKQLLQNSIKLIKGLNFLKIPYILNEQYPKGLGSTIAPIKELLKDEKVFEKVTFSCCATEDTMKSIKSNNRKFVIVFGVEAHVCVLQSVLDLIEADFVPIVVTNCIDSRDSYDKRVAIDRMIQAGAVPTTYESLLFELCGSAKNEAFKEISRLVK